MLFVELLADAVGGIFTDVQEGHCCMAISWWSYFQPGWTAKMINLFGALATVTPFNSSAVQPPFPCVSLSQTEHLHIPPGTENMYNRNFVLFEVSQPIVLLTI
jgi:hypothetical protein